MKIVPIRNLKDTVKIEKMCEETKEPIFITKNGYGKLVIMNMECFDRLIRKAYEASLINESLDSADKKDLIDGDRVLNELKKKCGL